MIKIKCAMNIKRYDWNILWLIFKKSRSLCFLRLVLVNHFICSHTESSYFYWNIALIGIKQQAYSSSPYEYVHKIHWCIVFKHTHISNIYNLCRNNISNALPFNVTCTPFTFSKKRCNQLLREHQEQAMYRYRKKEGCPYFFPLTFFYTSCTPPQFGCQVAPNILIHLPILLISRVL